MKLTGFLLIAVLVCVSCSHEMPRHVVSNEMPGDTEPRPEPEKTQIPPEARQAGLSPGEALAIAVAAGAIAYWFFDPFGKKRRRGNCNDCLGDGILHRGDPGVRVIIFKKAYRCPLCDGRGHM